MLHDTNADQSDVAASTTEDVLRHHLRLLPEGRPLRLDGGLRFAGVVLHAEWHLAGSTPIRNFRGPITSS